jgi:glutathione S-transferase
METSAELFYLLKKFDKDDKFGFKDDLERSECLQWTFFWHGSGAPYAGPQSPLHGHLTNH